MNPALPVLLALSLGGLAAYRFGRGEALRDLGMAWAVAGLAATLLLAPALALPDGIPSSGANLGRLVPWQAAPGAAEPLLDSDAGNPHLRDIVQQVQPWLLFTRAELRDGRLPFWNPHQFSGTPFWSNGSSAPLFPFHLLFAALPVQLGFVLLPWIRLVVGGCGAFALARRLGTSREAALVAAVAYPLSGMIASWVLYPMANAHALVPWVLWATEGVARRPEEGGASAWRSWRGWGALGLLGGLQLGAGHPETAVFTGLLTLVYLAVRGGTDLAAWTRYALGWLAAGLVAAVHVLPLALTLLRSSKWLAPHVTEPLPLPLIGELLLRLVLPDLHGNATLGTWWGPFNQPATAIYAGAVTLPLAAAGLASLREDRRWARPWVGVAAFTLFALLAAYQAPGMRHLLGALPVLEKSLTHYLKFGLDLGLVLLAARGLDQVRAGGGRRAAAIAAGAVLALLGLSWLLFSGPWAEHGLTGRQAAWTAGIAAAVLLAAAAPRLGERHRRRFALAVPALLAADLALAHAWANPALPAAKLFPETPAVRFLETRASGGLTRLAGVGTSFQPNAALVFGLYDVRGDTPVKLESYQRVYASFASPHPVYYRPIRDWASPWLDRLGVRYVIGPPAGPPPAEARAPGRRWRRIYAGDDARIWRRPGALPLVRWREDAPGAAPPGTLEVLARAPGSWLVAWEAERPATIVVAESWDPGWRATVERTGGARGEEAEVEPVDEVLMGVEVGPGRGRLALVYRPEGWAWGVGLTLFGLAACTLDLVRRQGSAPTSDRGYGSGSV